MDQNEAFGVNNGAPKIGSKKVPPRTKSYTIHRSGGPWRSSLACALFRQETGVVRAAFETLFEIITEKNGLGSTNV